MELAPLTAHVWWFLGQEGGSRSPVERKGGESSRGGAFEEGGWGEVRSSKEEEYGGAEEAVTAGEAYQSQVNPCRS